MKAVLSESICENIPETLPVIPTVDVVVFPHIIVPLLILDEKIITGVRRSLEHSKMVLLLAAKEPSEGKSEISTHDLYTIGTVGNIMRTIDLPEGGLKILVQGLCKARVSTLISQGDTLCASIELLERIQEDPLEIEHCVQQIKTISEKIAMHGYPFSPDFHAILTKMHEPQKIGEFILTHLALSIQESQALLETMSEKQFLSLLSYYLQKEILISEIQEKIRNSARDSMNESQKEYYLREQLRAIKKELGEEDNSDLEEMRKKLELLSLSEEVKKEIERSINRLENTAPDSLEANVTRNHLEWVFALPWGQQTEDNLDLEHAKKILDEDHYGLDIVKDRILDFISVRNLNTDGYAPILCFTGPPGTGKTSLGKSIARSLNRHYARISLGGVKDEAEIRGHRRTYVGAMPGRFIQAIRKAGSLNPLVVIDEIDKIGSDFRGDPAAAMLEVLDPHQNQTFYDNYLGFPFDLSKVLFVATANNIDLVSDPLRDRMEIIELSGYTIEEKVSIARSHLVQKSIKAIGLADHDIPFSDLLLETMIMQYTSEAGVRNLERIIQKLCSKIARTFVEKKEIIILDEALLPKYLGCQRLDAEEGKEEAQIGISNGLAWTAHGGKLLKIEAVLMPGKGKLILTGQLGDIMKESAQAALSYVRSHAKQFGISDVIFSKYDIHIHIPSGAIPKDGPSAGITLLTAMVSAITSKPVHADYAMTGEVNLRGNVMSIGGVKEKILAAKRNNVKHVILPSKNKVNVAEFQDAVKDMELIFVDHVDEVLSHVILGLSKYKNT
jgi:ATP-dependent Lon protease